MTPPLLVPLRPPVVRVEDHVQEVFMSPASFLDLGSPQGGVSAGRCTMAEVTPLIAWCLRSQFRDSRQRTFNSAASGVDQSPHLSFAQDPALTLGDLRGGAGV